MSYSKSMFSLERPSPICLALVGGGGTGAERRAVHGRNEVMKEGGFKDAGKEDLRVGGRP